MGSSTYEQIYAVVQRIPKGRVATYGQVASFAGISGQARQVGYALSALSEDSAIPWHRVVNARGEVSKRAKPIYEEMQRLLLVEEGIYFDGRGQIALARYRWKPRELLRQ